MIPTARPALSFPQAAAALAYRDMRSWRNRLAVALESRWRLLGYVPAAAFAVAGIVGRFWHRGGAHALLPIPHAWVGVAATFVPTFAFVALGTAVIVAVSRGPILFQQNSPDPYLYAGSAMTPRHVVLWLLITRSRLVQLAVSAVLALVFLPTAVGVSGGQGVAWVTVGRTLGLLPAAVSLPAFALSRRLPHLPLRQIGYGVVGVGFVIGSVSGVVALGSGGAFAKHLQDWLLLVPPGSFAFEAFNGQAAGVAGLVLFAAAFAAVTWWLAGDAYPELFTGHDLHQQLAARRSGGAADDLRAGMAKSMDGGVPAREWVLLWRWWVLERRFAARWRLLVYGVAVAAGAVVGFVLDVGPPWLSVAAAILFALLASSSNGVGQSSPAALEFRTPMWHLVAAPLGNRLRVLTLGNALSMWSLMAILLLASGLPRPWLLPELFVGAIAVGGYLWLRQSLELLFALVIPDSVAQIGPRSVIFPAVSVLGLAAGMVLFIHFAGPLGPLVLLLPLVVLLPAGYAVTEVAARMLAGNEIPIALTTTR